MNQKTFAEILPIFDAVDVQWGRQNMNYLLRLYENREGLGNLFHEHGVTPAECMRLWDKASFQDVISGLPDAMRSLIILPEDDKSTWGIIRFPEFPAVGVVLGRKEVGKHALYLRRGTTTLPPLRIACVCRGFYSDVISPCLAGNHGLRRVLWCCINDHDLKGVQIRSTNGSIMTLITHIADLYPNAPLVELMQMMRCLWAQ